jgi:predicted transcriptional regulator YdeE
MTHAARSVFNRTRLYRALGSSPEPEFSFSKIKTRETMTETLVKPVLVEKDAMMLVGISVETANIWEAHPETAQIPALWDRFFKNAVANKITHRQNPHLLFGAYSNYESDYRGKYTQLVGAEVAQVEILPEDFTAIHVPAQTYLVFKREGVMPKAVNEAWQDVWFYFNSSDAEYERAYTVDFERYNQYNPEFVEVFVAVRPKPLFLHDPS